MAINPSSPYTVPFSVLWAPLPIISWIFPLVGHVGISDSSGHLYDFASSFRINKDDMMCAPPARILTFPLSIEPDTWDAAIDFGNSRFSQKQHHIIMENCHSHVCECLNGAFPTRPYSNLKLYWLILTKGIPIGPNPYWRTYGGPALTWTLLLTFLFLWL